jgi:chaperonin GroES
MLTAEQLRPIAPSVIITRLTAEKTYNSLIVLPDTQYYKNRRCRVEKAHSGRNRNGVVTPCVVEPGDLVEVVVFDGEVLNSFENQDLERVDEDNIICKVVDDKIVPLHNFVFIKPDPVKLQTYGMILLPDLEGKESNTGVVLATGPGRINLEGKFTPMETSPGDKVVIVPHSAIKIEIGKEKFFMVRETEILAIC